jgi:hypothetical protein
VAPWLAALVKRTALLERVDHLLRDRPEWKPEGVTDRTVELVRADGKGIWVYSHDLAIILESIDNFNEENPCG